MANYSTRQMLLPASDTRNYGKMPNWQYVTIHNTANRMPAKNEVSYVHSRQGEVTYHFAIDDKECIQLLPLTKTAWHAGDGRGSGNMKSVAIEICYSLDKGDKRYPIAEDNASHKAAELLYSKGFGVDRLRKHQDWSGKYCPHRMLDNNGWNAFKQRTQKYLNELNNFSTDDFINKISPLAKKAWETDKILPSLTIAQAILESDWGRSELATQANALFGIKAHTDPTHKKTYTKTTWEYSNGKYIQIEAKFKAYDSWEESIRDRSKYLATRHIGGVHIYKDLIGETDYKKACEKIYKAGYATDPKYPKKLIDIIEKYKLNKFDKLVEGEVKLAADEKEILVDDKKDIYVVAYKNDGDLANALALYSALRVDQKYLQAGNPPAIFKGTNIIQVGGGEISNATVKLVGKNRTETLNEVSRYIEKLEKENK